MLAGVMPSSIAAAPRLAGWFFSSLSMFSLERPIILITYVFGNFGLGVIYVVFDLSLLLVYISLVSTFGYKAL